MLIYIHICLHGPLIIDMSVDNFVRVISYGISGSTDPDCKNIKDQPCSCPRDWRVPLKCSVHHSSIELRGLKGALNCAPMIAERRQSLGQLYVWWLLFFLCGVMPTVSVRRFIRTWMQSPELIHGYSCSGNQYSVRKKFSHTTLKVYT